MSVQGAGGQAGKRASAESADVRGRAQRVIDQAMESSGPPAAGTPERVLWDTAVGLARDVIALTDKVYDRGSDALVNDVEPEGAAAGDPPSREDARSLHASGGRRLAAGPGSLARREVFPPDSTLDAPAGVGEARPAEPLSDEWQRIAGEWKQEAERQVALAEDYADQAGRLQEQLDAETRGLELVRRIALSGPGPDTTETEALATIAAFVEKRLARAARGVVGPPPDLGGALGQTASETRGGDQ